MIKMRKVGFLTIGQSPRKDILEELKMFLSTDLEIIEAGALDGLNDQEINLLSPDKECFPLISRLADGRKVILSREKILPRLQAKISELEKKAEVVAMLCTDVFPELSSQKTLILPYELMKKEVLRFSPQSIIVFVPLNEQALQAKQKWSFQEAQGQMKVEVISLNPYELDQEKTIESFSHLLAQFSSPPDLAIFDCFGYPLAFIQAMAPLLTCPCLKPRQLLAQAINMALAL